MTDNDFILANLSTLPAQLSLLMQRGVDDILSANFHSHWALSANGYFGTNA